MTVKHADHSRSSFCVAASADPDVSPAPTSISMLPPSTSCIERGSMKLQRNNLNISTGNRVTRPEQSSCSRQPATTDGLTHHNQKLKKQPHPPALRDIMPRMHRWLWKDACMMPQAASPVAFGAALNVEAHPTPNCSISR